MLSEKNIGMYVCGPTVYDEPHIGHARSAYIFDMITAYLKFRGFKITLVRNITDIDDKIISKARQEIESSSLPMEDANLAEKVKAVAEKYLVRYHEDMDLLGLKRPDIEPKATETIKDMVKFIKDLIDKEYAYEVSGNVYFNVRKFSRYGELSGQSLDEMEEGVRVALDKNKKDPLDFALWKASKENEPFWPSPWGKGRPGWHLECSVMSTKFLKNKFLIHGGGLDLVFPHHENEIAQSVAAGKKTAKYWIHNGLLTIDGQKMSKSLGNFISVEDFLSKHKDSDILKLFFLYSHYRHPVDYTDEKIEEMKRAKERITIFSKKVDDMDKTAKKTKPKHIVMTEAEKIEDEFVSSMDDDFNTPEALAAIFKLVGLGNVCIANKDISSAKKIRETLIEFYNILGLSLKHDELESNLKERVESLIEKRNAARREKNFKTADEIRESLLKEKVVLEDTPKGTVWRKRL